MELMQVHKDNTPNSEKCEFHGCANFTVGGSTSQIVKKVQIPYELPYTQETYSSPEESLLFHFQKL